MLEPHGIFGPSFADLYILLCPANGMQNIDEASPSIISVGRGLKLVKMLITLETHGIF